MIARDQTRQKDCGLPPEIKRAVIAYQGELTPDYRYIAEYLTRKE